MLIGCFFLKLMGFTIVMGLISAFLELPTFSKFMLYCSMAFCVIGLAFLWL